MSLIYGDDWVPVIPGQDGIKAAAQELLTIAGDPALVRTAGNGTEFLVPSWVADAFVSPPAPEKKRAPRARKSED